MEYVDTHVLMYVPYQVFCLSVCLFDVCLGCELFHSRIVLCERVRVGTMLPKFTNPFSIDDAMSELTTLHILTTDVFFSMIIRFLPYKHIGTYMYVPRR